MDPVLLGGMAMTHFRSMFDSEYAGVWDLDGADKTVTINRVAAGRVGGQQGRAQSKKAILSLAELEKPMVCNVTNAKAIAGMYGSDTRAWVGKKITLYPAVTSFGGEQVDCIRVRPTIPAVQKPSKPRHPAEPISKARTAAELTQAIELCAVWITDNHEKAWPRVLARCQELSVPEDVAWQTLELATKGAP